MLMNSFHDPCSYIMDFAKLRKLQKTRKDLIEDYQKFFETAREDTLVACLSLMTASCIMLLLHAHVHAMATDVHVVVLPMQP